MNRDSSLLVVLLVILFEPLCVRGQDCTWTGIVNIDGKNAPGSNATFVVTSTKVLSDGIFLKWTLNSGGVAQHSYSSSTSQFSTITLSSRYIASITKDSADVVTTKLTIQNVQLNETGQPVGIFRSNCPGSSGNGKTIPLVIQNCDKEFFNPNATASSPSACGYNCTELFVCDASSCFNGSFQRKCLTNATWGSSLHSCTEIACDILPAFMRFPTGVLNIMCGSSGTVECDGGSAMCGGTTATCLSTGGNVTLEDPNFSCSKTCDLGVFADVATSAHIAPRCGDSVHFECHRNSSCGQTFERNCSRNGSWERLDHPCKKSCPTAQTWAVAFGILSTVLWAFLLIRACIQCRDDACSCFNGGDCCKLKEADRDPLCFSFGILLLPAIWTAKCLNSCQCCCKSFFWTAFAIYCSIVHLILFVVTIVLLVQSEPDCCGNGKMIGGIVVWVIDIATLTVFIGSTFSACTAVTAKECDDLNERASPHPASNSTDKSDEDVLLPGKTNAPVACIQHPASSSTDKPEVVMQLQEKTNAPKV